jgi:phospho-N-acetylmuramoyl-pentapeptide-transferase
MEGFGAVLTACIAFFVTAISGFFIIPVLKRLKFGQSINKIGPVWHKFKQGTPIMGGIMFVIGILAAMLVFALVVAATGSGSDIPHEYSRIAGGVFMALAFGFIGFMDDYIKVVKKRNLGLTARQKLAMQLLVGSAFLVIEYLSGNQGTTFILPFINITLNFGFFYWPIALIFIVGMVNAVNLTDGIDGLAGSVTFIVAIALMLCSRIVELSGFAALSAALAGSCLGFLVWNMHPAKVFMGDTGSMFLGGMICAIAFGTGYSLFPLLLVPLGIIYLIEMFSVIIQIISFKTTGKRVFKMSPIHHHYEMSGWSEVKIVAVFSVITLIFSLVTVIWLAYYMGQLNLFT